MQFTKVHQKLAKPVYEAIPKIAEKAGKEWKWKPKVGEWWRLNDYIWLIKDDSDVEHCQSFPPPNIVVPLLHWEDHLEPILEGFGWVLWDMKRTVPSSDGTGSLVVVKLAKEGSVRRGQGKDRQEAFQRAILALVEE